MGPARSGDFTPAMTYSGVPDLDAFFAIVGMLAEDKMHFEETN
jgi:hypothetical protein